MRFALALTLTAAASASAQESAAWPYPQLRPAPATTPTPAAPQPPGPPPSEFAPAPAGLIPDGLPVRTIRVIDRPADPGQQHWVSVNLGVLQPFMARVGVKVRPHPRNSVWLEAFAGSSLFNQAYGFGVRLQHSARMSAGGNRLMVAPGLGVHILPHWDARTETWYTDPASGYRHYDYAHRTNTLYYAFGDIDISWLHDFGPHLGWELGVKLGIAGRVSGRVGNTYSSFVMFGRDAYPILSIYSGFRF